MKKFRGNKGKYSQRHIGYCDVCGWVVDNPLVQYATEDNDRTMTDGICDTCGAEVCIEPLLTDMEDCDNE